MWKLALVVGLLVVCATAQCRPGTVLQQWDFGKTSDRAGWGPADRLQGPVADGALSIAARGSAILLESPAFEIPAKSWQRLEIEMSSDSGGTGYVYYSNTTDQPYNGFRPGQYATFDVPGDGNFHTHIVYPFWERHAKIVHIRVDPPGENVRLRIVRIVDVGGQPQPVAHWDLRRSDAGWTAGSEDTALNYTPTGLKLSGNYKTLALAPPLDMDTRTARWATLRLASTTNHVLLLRCALSGVDGLQPVPVKVRGDGVMRSYAIDLGALPDWTGQLKAIAVSPAERTDAASVTLQTVSISADKPTGPASPRIASLKTGKPFVREGEEFTVEAVVRNDGGETAGSLTVGLTGGRSKSIPALASGEQKTLTWQVKAATAGP